MEDKAPLLEEEGRFKSGLLRDVTYLVFVIIGPPYENGVAFINLQL